MNKRRVYEVKFKDGLGNCEKVIYRAYDWVDLFVQLEKSGLDMRSELAKVTITESLVCPVVEAVEEKTFE